MPAEYSVLLIEDEVNLAFTLKHALEDLSEGRIAVVACYNGRDGVEALFKQKFDLVISDLRLPDVSGLALLARIRKKLDPQIKTILMTAFGSDEVRAQADVFTDAFLTKPFDPLELIALVGEMLHIEGLEWDDGWGEEAEEVNTADVDIDDAEQEQVEPTAVGEIRLDSSNEAQDLCPNLYDIIKTLSVNVSASHIALLDVNGHVLLDHGETRHADPNTLNILLANSMASSGEVARHLPKSEPFLLHYYGNEQQEVYCCAVNKKSYLMLGIDLQITVTRVGSVWMYLKRAVGDIRHQADELAQLDKLSSQLTSENFNMEVETALTEALFGDDMF